MQSTAQDIDVRELTSHDLLETARCVLLDADTFPHPSIPPGLPPGLQTLIAVTGGREVLGFVTSTARSGVRYIHGLAVAPGARRMGIGRALLSASVERARAAGARSLVLHVGIANRAAVVLYDAAGFELRRVLRDYYRPGLYASRHAYELALPLVK